MARHLEVPSSLTAQQAILLEKLLGWDKSQLEKNYDLSNGKTLRFLQTAIRLREEFILKDFLRSRHWIRRRRKYGFS